MYSINRSRIKESIGSLRRWVDGTDSDVSAKIGETQREPREAELFLKAVARELEACLLRESFAPPNLPLCFPPHFIVFLSPAEDKQWLGNKRRSLIKALTQAMEGKVRELDGRQKSISPPTITLRMDATLEAGQIRINAVWDTSDLDPTLVVSSDAEPEETRHHGNHDDEDTTHVYLDDAAPDGDPTQILLPETPLYHIEVRRGDFREALVPIKEARITIGRGARTIPVDLRLKDPNISRKHAILERDVHGNYWLTSLGQNPTVVDGHEISREQRVKISPSAEIEICSYSLSLR